MVLASMATTSWEGDRFWKFSLRFYRQVEIEQTCLALQDKAGADVNLVLLCLYVAQLGYRITEQGIVILDQRIAPWRNEVIRPLRQARHAARSLKEEDPALYQDIQSAELAAEKRAQRELGKDVSDHIAKENIADAGELARLSLSSYLIDYLKQDADLVQPYIDLLIHRIATA